MPGTPQEIRGKQSVVGENIECTQHIGGMSCDL